MERHFILCFVVLKNGKIKKIKKQKSVYQMEISKKQTYEQYQLQWMIDHGFSLKDLMESMDRYFMNDGDSIQELFEDWECNCGFGGILYACKDEAIDCGECIEDEEE